MTDEKKKLRHIHDLCASFYTWIKMSEVDDDIDPPSINDYGFVLGHIMSMSMDNPDYKDSSRKFIDKIDSMWKKKEE